MLAEIEQCWSNFVIQGKVRERLSKVILDDEREMEKIRRKFQGKIDLGFIQHKYMESPGGFSAA